MARREAASPFPAMHAGMRVVLLHGKDALLRQLLTEQLVEALKAEHGEIQRASFLGGQCTLADVLDECRSFGLLAEHKLIVIDDADQLVREDTRPALERYAASPSDGATLVLRAERWYPGNLDKAIAKAGLAHKCDALDEATAAMWATKRCEKRHGAPIDRRAAAMLVDRVGTDLATLDSELARLAAHALSASGTVTPEAVAELVGARREEEVWGVQETLLRAGMAGDADAALAHLRRLIDVSRQPPTLIQFALTDLARKMHHLAVGQAQGQNAFSLAGKLRIWPRERAAAMGEAAGRAGPRATADLLHACVDADRRMKSGLGSDERTLERETVLFVRTLSGVGTRGGAGR
ncbi:MAG: DNA polymerase III subunit delta [Phycisphaerales bacterium]|jgi:DNA polymerase III delta subunit|nr:DNA polymerase III subunit delta [Phycisphaerales bacterium]